MIMKVSCSIFFCVVLSTLPPSATPASERLNYGIPVPLSGSDFDVRAVPVMLESDYNYVLNSQGPFYSEDCAILSNVTGLEAVRVTVVFALADASGNLKSAPLQANAKSDIAWSKAAGVKVCKAPGYPAVQGDLRLVAFINRIDTKNGTVWQAPETKILKDAIARALNAPAAP